MRIKRFNARKLPFNLPPIRETKEVQVLWCDDGWAYIPQIKIRRNFVTTDTDELEYTEETWDGIVPAKVLYNETIMHSVYNHKKMWMEVGNEYSELYVIHEA